MDKVKSSLPYSDDQWTNIINSMAQFQEDPVQNEHIPTQDEENPLKLFLFDQETVSKYGARCLDGSPHGYYFRKAPEHSIHSNKFAFLLEGGGICVTSLDCH